MKPELWGGVECTVNRVGSRFHDQMMRSGHHHRPSDLDLFADLGLKTLRYPILWEQVQPVSANQFDWAWSDGQMARLRELGIRPVVGLLHHGSGPVWTDLLNPEFPRQLADFALAVANRYPWIDAYTPVNEPLTTARFSALYGHWYPHHKDDTSFVRVLLNEIEGTCRAMEAIRTVRPNAILVQTEDLGKTYSTELLRYQADFENHRRWITFDLLTGAFDEKHPLWKFVTGTGIGRTQLDFIAAHRCPPDIYGFNYYVTSERFLDDQVDRHPAETHGSNRFHSYADVSAVRGRPEGLAGVQEMLREAWERYHGTLALTEVHLGCTREEQVRWLVDAWAAGESLIAEGIDFRAITTWALLGAYDWNGLVTRSNGDYEPGAFDVRAAQPRPTAIARAIRSLSRFGDFSHPILGVSRLVALIGSFCLKPHFP